MRPLSPSKRSLAAALSFFLAAELLIFGGSYVYLDAAFPTSVRFIEENLEATAISESFDLASAKKVGYSEREIAAYLAGRNSDKRSKYIQTILVVEGILLAVALLIVGGLLLLRQPNGDSRKATSDRFAVSADTQSSILSSPSPSSSEHSPQYQRGGEKSAQLLFAFLRIVRGICGFLFVLQVVGLLPVLTWLQQPSAVPLGAFAQVLVKVVALLLFAGLFFGLRNLINRLHTKRRGSPHPALVKTWAL